MYHMNEAIFISSILIMFCLGMMFSVLLIFKMWQFLLRWRQAGREGYGFEYRGFKRIHTGWRMFVEYDLWGN